MAKNKGGRSNFRPHSSNPPHPSYYAQHRAQIARIREAGATKNELRRFREEANRWRDRNLDEFISRTNSVRGVNVSTVTPSYSEIERRVSRGESLTDIINELQTHRRHYEKTHHTYDEFMQYADDINFLKDTFDIDATVDDLQNLSPNDIAELQRQVDNSRRYKNILENAEEVGDMHAVANAENKLEELHSIIESIING